MLEQLKKTHNKIVDSVIRAEKEMVQCKTGHNKDDVGYAFIKDLKVGNRGLGERLDTNDTDIAILVAEVADIKAELRKQRTTQILETNGLKTRIETLENENKKLKKEIFEIKGHEELI